MRHEIRRPAPPAARPSIPVLELLILLAVITGGLSFDIDLGRLFGLAPRSAQAQPAEHPGTPAAAPARVSTRSAETVS